MRLFAPAKVNLFLHVLGKREDGYHEVETLMQTISLFDIVTIEQANEDYLFGTDPSIPYNEQNLAAGARKLFRTLTGILTPVSIHLQKRIPTQSGLGGGSSNAATVLFGLNELFCRPLSLEEMQKTSASLGSDVSFFFSHGTALCKGRGEIIEKRPPLAPRTLWIAAPSFGCSTGEVYARARPNGDDNHLQEAAYDAYPALAAFGRHLPPGSYLTGSGSAFICPEKPEKVDSYQACFCRRAENQWYTPALEFGMMTPHEAV